MTTSIASRPARRWDYRDTFQYFRPGFDLATERERRVEVGGRLGVQQPSSAFFARVIEEAGHVAGRCSTSGTAWTTTSGQSSMPV